MSRVYTLALALLLPLVAACTTIERAAIPAAEIDDKAWTAFSEGSTITVDHTPWDRFLATYRVEGSDGIARLRYGAVTAGDRAALTLYLSALESVDTAALDRPEQLAFWINLYNAKTVDLVLDAYPVDTIRRVGSGLLPTGPWGLPVLRVAGRPLSLNDIEHTIVRPIWQDPRIHYAFNCAALGCPNLIEIAYTGANVEIRLEANARAYVNDPRGFRFDGDRLTASKIYIWFQEDFGGSEQGVLDHAIPYAAPDLAARLEAANGIDAYDYDWGLNDAGAQGS